MGDGPLIGALDQGTTSTRFMVFTDTGRVVSKSQVTHRQIQPRPGWTEHDPLELLERTRAVVSQALSSAGLDVGDLAAVGLTNQRETTVVWDRLTGQPLGPALVWHDTRTAELVHQARARGMEERIRKGTGLPLATYFPALKLAWLLEHVAGLRAAADTGRAAFGTVDSWLLWNLTGGPRGGVHVIDPTNAARTQLCDLGSLTWDEELLGFFDVPRALLPDISWAPEPERGEWELPIRAALGDQHAALLGQGCVAAGDVKNTYGTGGFLLMNTGSAPTGSGAGLLTTLGYDLGRHGRAFALEGSVPVAGSLFGWLTDGLGLLASPQESEALARSVPDSAGVYLVPAFSGLFSPHWRPDARGVIVGLTAFTNRAHLARAAIEAIGHQTADVVDAMCLDAGTAVGSLRVDGGVTANDLCMQSQADILGVPVRRAAVAESTALGAALAAGLTSGVYASLEEAVAVVRHDRTWEPGWSQDRRDHERAGWLRAVERTT